MYRPSSKIVPDPEDEFALVMGPRGPPEGGRERGATTMVPEAGRERGATIADFALVG